VHGFEFELVKSIYCSLRLFKTERVILGGRNLDISVESGAGYRGRAVCRRVVIAILDADSQSSASCPGGPIYFSAQRLDCQTPASDYSRGWGI